MTEKEAKKILFWSGVDREQVEAFWVLFAPYVERLILVKLEEFVEGFIEKWESGGH